MSILIETSSFIPTTSLIHLFSESEIKRYKILEIVRLPLRVTLDLNTGSIVSFARDTNAKWADVITDLSCPIETINDYIGTDVIELGDNVIEFNAISISCMEFTDPKNPQTPASSIMIASSSMTDEQIEKNYLSRMTIKKEVWPISLEHPLSDQYQVGEGIVTINLKSLELTSMTMFKHNDKSGQIVSRTDDEISIYCMFANGCCLIEGIIP